MPIVALLLVLALLVPQPALAADGASRTPPDPRDVVAGAVHDLLGLVGQPSAVTPGAADLSRVSDRLFDVPDMARRTFSRRWTTGSTKERTEFVETLSGLLRSTFVAQVRSYAGQPIRYAEAIDGPFATVTATSGTTWTEDRGTQYRLSLAGGQWKAYDIVTAGFSFVSTYRTQFANLVDARTFTALLDSLRAQPSATTDSSSAADEQRRKFLFLPSFFEHLVRRR